MLQSDQDILNALDRARSEHEDLAGLLDLYGALATVQYEAKAQVHVDLDALDEVTIRQRVAEGLPQLTFGDLSLEPVAFARLVKDITGVLVDHSSDWAEVATSMDEPTSGELMKLARDSFEGKTRLSEPDLSASGLMGLAIEFALVPHLERAAEALLPRVDQSLWLRGYCPVCGAVPDLALLDEESGARHLLCSRCNSQWRYVRLRCPFCGTSDSTKLQYYPGDDETYRLYVCEDCKHYLKTIDLRVAQTRLPLRVERLLTVRMDVAAQQKGYLAGQGLASMG